MIYYKSFEGYFTFNFLLVICVLEILLFLFASHDLILIGHGLFEEINLQGAPVFCFFFFFFYYLISKQALDNKKSLKEGQIWVMLDYLEGIWHCDQNVVCQKFEFCFLLKIIIIFFYVFESFWYVDFKKNKKILFNAFPSEKTLWKATTVTMLNMLIYEWL